MSVHVYHVCVSVCLCVCTCVSVVYCICMRNFCYTKMSELLMEKLSTWDSDILGHIIDAIVMVDNGLSVKYSIQDNIVNTWGIIQLSE